MKLLAALLVFMIAAQPVQAGFCDLDLSDGAEPHTGMVHDAAMASSDHDCCQSPDTEDGRVCSDMAQCGPSPPSCRSKWCFSRLLATIAAGSMTVL